MKNELTKYTIVTTNLREIIVEAKNEEDAESIVSPQFEDWEVVMMIYSEWEL